MRIDVIQTLDAFESIAGEWNELLSFSASDVPFLRHEFLTGWWRTLGGGEWPHGELYVLAARSPDDRLQAVAPLFFTHNLEGEAALLLLGSIEVSDYLDVIATPESLPTFIPALCEHLAGPEAPPWEVLDLYNLLEDSPTLPLLKSAAEQRGWSYTQTRLHHCPYISLPGDWETYLSSLDKKQRHEIRRKLRRAEGYEKPVRWYFVNDESRLDDYIESFFWLMAQDEEKKAFLTEPMRLQMRHTIWAAFRGGWLQFAFLEVGEERAAAYLNFDYANHIWVYNSGLDYNFSTISPGWVLLAYLLQWANQHKRQAFDFMRGNEEYKYRFGAIDRFIVRASIRR